MERTTEAQIKNLMHYIEIDTGLNLVLDGKEVFLRSESNPNALGERLTYGKTKAELWGKLHAINNLMRIFQQNNQLVKWKLKEGF